jgi:hypothetical protein
VRRNSRSSLRLLYGRRYLWDRTLRLLLPTIFYITLVQPFLFWLSDSSASSMAAAYQEEVEDYSEFFVDAMGNELPIPQPHTNTLGECAVANSALHMLDAG